MKCRIQELTGALLDAAVAKAEGMRFECGRNGCYATSGGPYGHMAYWRPSAHWADGGPIIERELHGVEWFKGDGMAWIASYGDAECPRGETGPTPLIAAMRAYVASKFGDEVELP